MPVPRMMMPAPRIRFSDFRRILTDIGFRRVRGGDPHLWFLHEEANLPLGFPRYHGNAIVTPHHLVAARYQLHWNGILDEDDFDRMVLAVAR